MLLFLIADLGKPILLIRQHQASVVGLTSAGVQSVVLFLKHPTLVPTEEAAGNRRTKLFLANLKFIGPVFWVKVGLFNSTKERRRPDLITAFPEYLRLAAPSPLRPLLASPRAETRCFDKITPINFVPTIVPFGYMRAFQKSPTINPLSENKGLL
jgi:hypothetical protein